MSKPGLRSYAPIMRFLLSRFPRYTLDFLFPLSCVVCGKEGKFICEGCEPALTRLSQPYCRVCANPGTRGICRWCFNDPLNLDGIRAPYLFEGPVREAVYSLKYRGVRAAAPEMGRLLARYLDTHPFESRAAFESNLPPHTAATPVDLIVPAPLHAKRLRDRGYNQAELLARSLSKEAGIPLDTSSLVRVKHSGPQVGESRERRRSNVDGSFRCDTDMTGKSVIVVDDVATTGSTLSACASALKNSGASDVWGLALAREA